MKRIGIVAALVAAASIGGQRAPAANAAGGTLKGHVRLNGTPPGNAVIRMAVDPMCSKLNAGKRPVQETVVASADGSLANVFVKLDGTFPPTPVPSTPVVIDQAGCLYIPRVVGARVGQTLQVRNSDRLLHNVHAQSTHANSFNVGQPLAGASYDFRLRDEETMLRLGCDIHRWMTSYVGVVNHPYFAVSSVTGAFEIASVPPGSYTVQAWHEQFGTISQAVRVRAEATTSLDLAFTPAASGR
jgi:hypothetical protein